MAVLIDTVTGAAGRPATRKRRIGRTSRRLRKPDWIRVKAPVSPGYVETRRDRARQRPAHRLRGGRLPQYRRVLGEEARHLHDHGRHLHARLRLLQRQDRPARRARCRRAGACRRGDRQARPRPCRHHLGRSRRSRRRRRRAFRRGDPRHPRALPHDHDRSADAGFSAQGRALRRSSSRRGPTCSTTISKPCRRNI